MLPDKITVEGIVFQREGNDIYKVPQIHLPINLEVINNALSRAGVSSWADMFTIVSATREVLFTFRLDKRELQSCVSIITVVVPLKHIDADELQQHFDSEYAFSEYFARFVFAAFKAKIFTYDILQSLRCFEFSTEANVRAIMSDNILE